MPGMIPEWIPLIPCHSGIDTGIFHNTWNFAKPALDEHQKRVEERGEAYLTSIGKIKAPQSENKPPETPPDCAELVHYLRSLKTDGQSSSESVSGNDYNACHKRSWAAGNKNFTWHDWHYAQQAHSSECSAPFTIPAKQQWQVHYEDAVAASEACELCYLITIITRRYSSRIGGEDKVIIKAYNSYHIPAEHICVSSMTLTRQALQDGDEASRDFSIHVRLHYLEPNVQFARLWLPVRRPIERLPLTRTCLDWVTRSWRACQEQHKECAGSKYPRAENVVPARCLWVGSGTSDATHVVDFDIGNTRYVALSYCWGKGSTLTLTLATLADFKTNISLSSMPKTYQQAVAFTRLLGLEYLWTDSICIVQEGGPDWRVESAKMGDIYRNAEIVLSGDCGANTDAGFSYERSTDWHSPDRIELPQRPDGPEYLVALTSPEIQHGVYSHGDPQDLPVSGRAWYFQERYSGTRIIHFKREELVWECKAGISCECGAISQPETLFQKTGYTYKQGKQRFHQVLAENKSTEDLSTVWSAVVNDYARRSLSVEINRLPAVSGIVRQMTSPLLGDYLARLWAPTWSWPAVLGGVTYHSLDKDEKYVCEVVRAECHVEGRNPYGCVSSGSLTVSAPISNARLQREVDSDSDSDSDVEEALGDASRPEPFSSRDAALAIGDWHGRKFDGSFYADYDWAIHGDSGSLLCHGQKTAE